MQSSQFASLVVGIMKKKLTAEILPVGMQIKERDGGAGTTEKDTSWNWNTNERSMRLK